MSRDLLSFRDLLVIYKRSRFERDLEHLGISSSELVSRYENWEIDASAVLRSHELQTAGLMRLKELLPQVPMLKRGDVTIGQLREAKVLIAFGGDNHFQMTSHLAQDCRILGINSDPETSHGALTRFTVASFACEVPNILAGVYNIEHWTRLAVLLDGLPARELALSEVYIGERDRCHLSRHVLQFGTEIEAQRGSGLLVVTGSGSTGWYAAAAPCHGVRSGDPFPAKSHTYRFLLTEPWMPSGKAFKLGHGEGVAEDVLHLKSLSVNEPLVRIDGSCSYPMRRGSRIEIRLGKPLAVVCSSGAQPAIRPISEKNSQ